MILYAATTNAGKLREFAECGGADGVEVLALPGLREMPEPVEDATTFMGNAELKAVAYSRLAPGMMVMADDSGLEVEALDGAPGVRSARFAEDFAAGRFVASHPHDDEAVVRMGHPASAGTHSSPEAGRMGYPALVSGDRDERNNALLLALMQDVPEGRRGARFVCALAVARDGEVVLRAEGVVEGELLREGRGDGGFGYDPLFCVREAGWPEFGLTTAELPRETKWAISHRGRAFRKLLRLARTQIR